MPSRPIWCRGFILCVTLWRSRGLALIARWLPVAVREPDNMVARGWYAGGLLPGRDCLYQGGLGLSMPFRIWSAPNMIRQHGLTNAIVLPVVLRYNLPGEEAKVVRMAQAMGLGRDDAAGVHCRDRAPSRRDRHSDLPFTNRCAA